MEKDSKVHMQFRLLAIETAIHALSVEMQGLMDDVPEAVRYGGRMQEALGELALEFRRLKVRLPEPDGWKLSWRRKPGCTAA